MPKPGKEKTEKPSSRSCRYIVEHTVLSLLAHMTAPSLRSAILLARSLAPRRSSCLCSSSLRTLSPFAPIRSLAALRPRSASASTASLRAECRLARSEFSDATRAALASIAARALPSALSMASDCTCSTRPRHSDSFSSSSLLSWRARRNRVSLETLPTLLQQTTQLLVLVHVLIITQCDAMLWIWPRMGSFSRIFSPPFFCRSRYFPYWSFLFHLLFLALVSWFDIRCLAL